MSSTNREKSYEAKAAWTLAFTAVAWLLTSSWAVAADCYWCGDENSDPLEPSNYQDADSKVLDALPPPGSSVGTKLDNMTIRFDDDSAAFLGSLSLITPRTGSRVIIDVSTNITIGTKFSLWGLGFVVKRGAGNLTLAPGSLTYDSQNRCFDYREKFIVEKGDVIFPQNVASNGKTYVIGGLSISNGCSVAIMGGMFASGNVSYNVRLDGGVLSGDGRVVCTNSSSECRFYAASGAEPFRGEIFATNAVMYVSGALLLAGTNNSFRAIYGKSGTIGARRFGNRSGTSSLGAYNRTTFNPDSNPMDFTVLNLATEEDGVQSCYRTIWDYCGRGRIIFDGGAYGGLKLGTPWNSSPAELKVLFGTYMKELVLTGSNTAKCVFAVIVNNQNNPAENYGYYYLSKRGTGTWKMADLRKTGLAKLAGIGVENGTLRFESIAESGTACSLGLAQEHLLGYPYSGSIAAAPSEVDYAIRLGNVTNLSEEGTLEYVSSSAMGYCTTRTIAVTGRGRVKNSAVNAAGTSKYSLRWTGFKSVVPPEDATLVPELSTLTFDGSLGNGWATNITEDVGAAPLRIAKEGTATWTLGGTLAFTGGIDVREGTLSVGAMSGGLPYLRCDGGATLALAGGPVEASALYVDFAKGIGTISGVAFASSGTLSVTNVPGNTASLACDLSGCTGLGNLSGWTILVDGRESGKFRVSANASGVKLYPKGMLMVFW